MLGCGLLFPHSAKAADVYLVNCSSQSGGHASAIASSTSGDFSGNNVVLQHGFLIGYNPVVSQIGTATPEVNCTNIVGLPSTANYPSYPGSLIGSYAYGFICPGPFSPCNVDIADELQQVSAVPGNYFYFAYSGNVNGDTAVCFFTFDGTNIDTSDCGTPPTPPDDCISGDTRICGFTPENGSVISGPSIDFTLDYYVNADDLTGPSAALSDVVIKLHNIDQNVLLLGFLSPGDKVLYDEVATSSGHMHFATTTDLGDGNYRLEASIRQKFFFNWFTVPLSRLNQTISKQFIVGEPTFIGNLTQNGFNILSGTLNGQSATSSIALVARCNPVGSFDMTLCLSGLFIPDANQIQVTIQGARDGILTRMPWGYVTRFVAIVGGSATTTLPTFTATVALNTASDTTEISFDPGDMFAGGAALAASIHSPYDSGVTFRSTFEPIIKLSMGIVVILTIMADIMSSHNHPAEPSDVRRRRV